MLKKFLVAAAATLTLAACGGPTAETYSADGGFEVTTEEAEAVDLSAYPDNTDGLLAMYADYDAPNCEPGLAQRDITNAYYADCDSDVDIRISENADAAKEAAEYYASNNPDKTVYRVDNVTVSGTPDAVEAFILTFGGAE